MSKTARKLKTKMLGFGGNGNFGVPMPKNLIELVKAELAKPFNYLEFGQDDFTEVGEYKSI